MDERAQRPSGAPPSGSRPRRPCRLLPFHYSSRACFLKTRLTALKNPLVSTTFAVFPKFQDFASADGIRFSSPPGLLKISRPCGDKSRMGSRQNQYVPPSFQARRRRSARTFLHCPIKVPELAFHWLELPPSARVVTRPTPPRHPQPHELLHARSPVPCAGRTPRRPSRPWGVPQALSSTRSFRRFRTPRRKTKSIPPVPPQHILRT